MERPPERLVVSGLLRAEADEVAAAFAARGMDGDGPEGGLGMERAAAGGTGDRLRGRAGRRAADRGARAPHAGADLARARRGDRRAGVPEGGEPAAGRRVQVPRRLQRRRLAHRRRSAPPASPPSPRATTRRRSRSPPRCTASKATILMPEDAPREQARGHARLRRRGDRLRPLRRRPRAAARRAGGRARARPGPPLRRPARDGRAGHGRDGAARAGRPARRAARLRRRRRADRRLRDGGGRARRRTRA